MPYLCGIVVTHQAHRRTHRRTHRQDQLQRQVQCQLLHLRPLHQPLLQVEHAQLVRTWLAQMVPADARATSVAVMAVLAPLQRKPFLGASFQKVLIARRQLLRQHQFLRQSLHRLHRHRHQLLLLKVHVRSVKMWHAQGMTAARAISAAWMEVHAHRQKTPSTVANGQKGLTAPLAF